VSHHPRPPPRFELRVLGPLEVWIAGVRQPLPRSKKTRALLAFLATTGRPHRRQRLCSLLWDVADDPRGALRWSLSRLRRAIGDQQQRVEADRQQVALRTDGMCIDAHELSEAVRGGVGQASTARLEQLAGLPRGEFLEGLDLADFLEYNAWCIAERERLREHHCAVLTELVNRLRDEPLQALGHARKRAQVDAFDLTAQTELLQLLLQAGKLDEARQRFDNARRLCQEVGAAGLQELERAWRGMRATHGRVPAGAASEELPASRGREDGGLTSWPFVGRQAELSQLEALLKGSQADGLPRVALVTGEPGAGKSRLAERLMARAVSAGFRVRSGRAYEAEGTRPYGPWVDALGAELQELLSAQQDRGAAGSREGLFAAVTERLAGRADPQAGVLLVLDDLQWLNRDSAELLHFMARTYRAGPLLILLLARGGELSDNEAGQRALRSLRKEVQVAQLELEPLSLQELEALLGWHADVDVGPIYEASGGNPLYAIELARARNAGVDDTPATLQQLVRERVERLPDHAADVLRWSAVLGHAVDIERLEALSSLPLDELVNALERLELHAMLRIDASRRRQRYVFGHDLVREAVHAEISHPRRRLMHRRVARLLEPQMEDPAVASEVAHHAGLGGEALLGVRACLVAGRQSLRVFANGDAGALARRGLRLAQDLPDPERVSSALDLLHVQYSARTPDRLQAAARVGALAQEALDLGLTRAARLGFQMLSYLRWESASMADAHENIMQAERISRSADPEERSVALAQAARCLVLLERNLGQAEAFAMEASALTSRGGRKTSAEAYARAMIASHRGEHEAAVAAFGEARDLARQHGQRLAEFRAVEHWVMLEIDRGGHQALEALAGGLAELGQRVRAGAEAPTGRGLLSLVRLLCGQHRAEPELDAALDELRQVDAKFELSYLLTRRAEHDLARGRPGEAAQHAAAGLEAARAVGRPSETALALATLARCARHQGDAAAHRQHAAGLTALRRGELSWVARQRMEQALGDGTDP
jgi:DNA-binding SARP family transcriptional activator